VARVVSANTLAEDSSGSVSQFSIRPGRQMQVIRLPQKTLAAQHVYVQVSAEPTSRNPDFSSSGVNEGILKHRPDKFVPFKVPIFDEAASLLQEQAYKKAKKDQPDKEFTKPKPLYWWAYRPELQFSVYELAVNEIQPVYGEQIGDNILEDDKPIINSREGFLEAPTSSDEFLRLIYDLQSNQNDALAGYSFDGDKELIFAFGEQEIKATVTQGGGSTRILEFDDLSVLSGLDPEDFLSMRLYLNNDAANILWEWAFSGEGRVVPRSLAEGKRSGTKRYINSLLRDDYFYPALGDKKLFVDMLGLGENDKVKIIKISDSALKTTPAMNVETNFHDGYAKFLLHGGATISPEDHNDSTPIKITFRIFPANDKFIDVTTEIIVKSNRNTSLSELLDGTAVWTNVDHIPDWSSKSDDKKGQLTGQTQPPSSGSDFGPDYQYFDYGQYMMNMVTIPLAMPVQESNLKYSIIPDGVYDGNTRKLMEALMGNTANAPIPEYTGQSLRDVGMSIGHHDNDFVEDTLLPNNTEIHSFRKLLQDYQPVEARPETMDQKAQVALELETDFKKIPRLATADNVYKIMTPEFMRGSRVLHTAENRTIAAGTGPSAGVFTDEDLGLYEMFRSYDWDGDGVSNLAEVENATQYSTTGSIEIASAVFNPISGVDTQLAEKIKTVYSRGYVSLGGTPNVPSSLGLGELSGFNGASLPGLRIPTFTAGMYDFPAGDVVNIDAYTSPQILNRLEMAGRTWAKSFPDTYPLNTNPLAHNHTKSGTHTGSRRFGINDISGKGGGVNSKTCLTVWENRNGRTIPCSPTLEHQSHQSGLDMDIRYVSTGETEKSVLVTGDFDVDKTIEMINMISNNGASVDFIFVGENISSGKYQEFIDTFTAAKAQKLKKHDDHIHIRFSRPQSALINTDDISIDYPDKFIYDPDSPEASKNLVGIQLKDNNGNYLLPWTRLRFSTKNTTIANSLGKNINSIGNRVLNNQLWINLENETDKNGKAILEVQCKSEGDTTVDIKDSLGNYLTELTVKCEVDVNGN